MATFMMIPTAAWAHACANLSRSEHAPAGEDWEIRGKWMYLPLGDGIWGMDHPQGVIPVTCNPARQTTNGIQRIDC